MVSIRPATTTQDYSTTELQLEPNMPPTLYLIDGHALAYRMYFALTAGGGGSQRWQTSKGEPTAGVYGFARELFRILEQ